MKAFNGTGPALLGALLLGALATLAKGTEQAVEHMSLGGPTPHAHSKDGTLVLAILPGPNKSGADSTSNCKQSCDLLLKYLGLDKVSQQNDTIYTLEQMYWSTQQAEVLPACRVTPLCTQDVATSLVVIEDTGCPFAVKSGGHAAFAGASNIQNGVTIDLRNLTMVKVADDNLTTSIGTGNRWLDAYEQLQPRGLGIVGGRVAHIGTGGLTLGGGISFFSGRRGWALDTVRNYEVVMSGGKILDVNYTSYPDLYFALRGGGNNFGIVTRMDVETFEQGDMWGGATLYNVSQAAGIASAYENFTNNASQDPDAAMYTALAYLGSMDEYFFSNFYTYAKPVVNPPVFHELTALPNLTSTARITTLSDLTIELNASNPDGFRETYWTATFRNSGPLSHQFNAIFQDEVNKIKDAKDVLPALTQQPITDAVISHFAKNGGNALGITPADGPLNLIDVAIRWTDAADDERILAAAKAVIERCVAAAKHAGLDSRYVYQNYAARGQDVFGGYGQENKQKLLHISRKYDPKRTFQKLQPGYFKIGI